MLSIQNIFHDLEYYRHKKEWEIHCHVPYKHCTYYSSADFQLHVIRMIFAVNEHVIVCVQVSCILKHRKTRYEPETGVLSQENFSHSRIFICLEGPLRLPRFHRFQSLANFTSMNLKTKQRGRRWGWTQTRVMQRRGECLSLRRFIRSALCIRALRLGAAGGTPNARTPQVPPHK